MVNYHALAGLEHTIFNDVMEPLTLKEATSSPEWVWAMELEIQALAHNGT